MTRAALGLAAVLLCIAAAAVLLFAQQVNQNIASSASQAQLIVPSTASVQAVRELERPGVTVNVVEGFFPRRPPPPALLGGIFHGLGIIPQRVRNGDRTFIVHPDEVFALRFFGAVFAALALVYGLALLLLRNAAKAAERAAMQPLIETTAALQALAAGDFTPQHIPAGQRADVRALAHAYTGASQRVARAIAEETEARAHMRRFIADAGHELRTPITIVNMYIDVLSQPGVQADAYAKITASMRAEMKRMRRLVENLLSLTRMEQDVRERQTIDAVRLTREVVERLSRIAGSREIVLSAPQNAPALGDERDIEDAIGNLIENALKYGGGSDVCIAIAAGEGCVSIDVDDAGPGVAEHDRVRLFDRFFRGANAGGVEGSGLGLAIAKLGVERSGGTLRYEPLSPGSRFRIELPPAVNP